MIKFKLKEENMKIFYTIFCSIFLVSSVYAQSANVVSSNSSMVVSYCDQGRCEAEANYMASKNITGHVWGTIGNFEGVGYGPSPTCRTCVPNNPNMRLTGDAVARGSNGMWYRVRSWR
jgi:hypothetical protein